MDTGDITIYGLRGHVAISGCRSSLESFEALTLSVPWPVLLVLPFTIEETLGRFLVKYTWAFYL